MGWHISSSAVLLYEWAWWAAWKDSADAPTSLESYFQPSSNRSPSSVPPPCEVAEDPDHRETDNNVYRTLCELVKSIYQALPPDWERLIDQDTESGLSYDSALRRQLRKVPPELRIRMEDLDAWLSLPDEYEDRYGGFEDEDEGTGEGNENADDEDESAKGVDVEGSK